MLSHILIAAAVKCELANLIDLVERPVKFLIGGRNVVSGYISDRPVRIIITGPALINNVQSLTAAIEDSRPSMIIQTGSGGAFKTAGLDTGDIGIATEEIDIHLGLESESGSPLINELPFSVAVHDGHYLTNQYPLDRSLAETAYNILKKILTDKNIGLKKAPFITVSTITATDRRAEDLYREFKPCMENMEGAGAAMLGLYYQIPCLEIRTASNITGKRNIEAWNFPLASERASFAVYELIQKIKK
jgi:futalosine hydrolase